MEEVKSEDKKKKFALYIHDSALDVARQWYARDNCASISEFIEKAVLFYGGYVANEKNPNYLPNIVMVTRGRRSSLTTPSSQSSAALHPTPNLPKSSLRPWVVEPYSQAL